ncbi:MAG: sigma-54 dependent transcriptional regulator [Planctomycetota bacterium]
MEDFKKAVRELLLPILRSRGPGGLREAEEIFGQVVAALREESVPLLQVLSPDLRPVDRARYAGIIGDSPAMLRVFGLIDRVAPSKVPVLIQGESGTGKELIARAIHEQSPQRQNRYITENCAAVPETLLESELFGYKKGAFTGAERDRKGLFEVAHKGTLFLDEVGDMSLSMQKKLLRVLQDGEIRPVGSGTTVHVDVRLISASNKLLRDLVDRGLFREDLYYRLNTVTIELPPLRDRREDIPTLVEFFLKRVAGEMGIAPPPLTSAALERLQAYRWPGNVRELENELRRCLALLETGKAVDVDDLSGEILKATG